MATSVLQLAAAGASRLSRSNTVVMGAVGGHHIFRVKGYSKAKEIINGQYMTLGAFHVGGHSWSLRYYPNGQSFKDGDYISFFLSRDNDLSNSGKPARWSLSILGPDGKPVSSFSKTSGTRCFNQTSYGYGQFMKREDFEKSECLKDDSFSIRCDVHVAAVEQDTIGEGLTDPMHAVVPSRSDLQKDLADLLWNKEGTDVTIDVGGEIFHAHRWLLAARSPEFKDKFFGLMLKKPSTHMQINDMEPRVFKSLLHFMYTDTLPKMDDKEATVGVAEDLIAAADKYKLEGLKKMCEDILCRCVDLTTVDTSLVLAEQHHCPALKAKCMEFLAAPGNLKAVMSNDGFQMVKKNCPTVLFDLVLKQIA